jgi:hypothetical protein
LITFMSGSGRTWAFGPAERAIQREPQRVRRRVGQRERDAEDRVRAEVRLVGRAVELEERAVELALVVRVDPVEGRRDHLVHVRHGPEHALAAEAFGVPVPELERLVLARRGAARHRGAAEGAVDQDRVDLDGGVPARIEHLAGQDGFDQGHGGPYPTAAYRCFR